MTACEIKSSDIIAHVRSRRQPGAGPYTYFLGGVTYYLGD